MESEWRGTIVLLCTGVAAAFGYELGQYGPVLGAGPWAGGGFGGRRTGLGEDVEAIGIGVLVGGAHACLGLACLGWCVGLTIFRSRSNEVWPLNNPGGGIISPCSSIS